MLVLNQSEAATPAFSTKEHLTNSVVYRLTALDSPILG